MNIRGKGNYRTAMEEAIIKVECSMSGLREKVGPMQYFHSKKREDLAEEWRSLLHKR